MQNLTLRQIADELTIAIADKRTDRISEALFELEAREVQMSDLKKEVFDLRMQIERMQRTIKIMKPIHDAIMTFCGTVETDVSYKRLREVMRRHFNNQEGNVTRFDF